MAKALLKRNIESDAENSEAELLDEQQQEQEIKSLEDSHAIKKSSVKWVLTFIGFLFVCVNGFNIYMLGFTISKAFTIASFVETTLRVLMSCSILKWVSFGFSFSGVVSYAVFAGEIPMFLDENLAFFPIVFNAVVQMFLVDMLSEENDIEELKKLRYRLKSA